MLRAKIRRRLARALIASRVATRHNVDDLSSATRALNAYSMIRTLAASYPPANLSAFEAKVFSQNGEDGVLAEIFRRIGVNGEGYFVEFGVESGIECNAAFLAHVCGWRGTFIEANDTHFDSLVALWKNSRRVTTIKSMVTAENVNEVIGSVAPSDFDLLSIDIDGLDYYVWDAFTACRPRVVVIEYGSTMDADRAVAQPSSVTKWDYTDLMGASIKAMIDLGKRKGYTLVHTEIAGVNAFFVRDDLCQSFAGIEVPMRSPNYYLRGRGHRKHEGGVEPLEVGHSSAGK